MTTFALGDRVSIMEADINGTIVEHTKYIDGSECFLIRYWHEGKREMVLCAPTELRKL